MKDLFNVKGKVALVTGGSRGIGAMIAEGFVKNGVKTYITSRKSEQCNNKADELSKFGECISIPADLTNMNEMDKLVNHIKENEITVLFVEEYTNENAVNSIVEDTGVSIEKLYTMEMAPIDTNDNYLSLMNKNLNNLVNGIGC